MNKRVLVAGLYHETNTFVENPTLLKDFRITRGAELLLAEGDASPLGGMLESAKKFGWTVLPTIDYRATPSGMVEDKVVEAFWREFVQLAEPCLLTGISAIYLVLHGAMVSQSFADVEGEILERIRKLRGMAKVPIFGVFDLHANFTQRMADHANCLVAYRENPHTDARQMAQHAAVLLDRCLETGLVPRTYWVHPPVMWPPTGTGTAAEPMLSLEKMAREIETGGIWSANVIAGFSFADTPDTGVSFTVVTDGPEDEARAALKQLSDQALATKEQGNVIDPPIESIMEKIAAGEPGLTVLVEPSDNIGAGAPGDGTGALRALVKHGIENAAVAIYDPVCIERLNQMPVGFETTLHIGGRGSKLDAGPFTLMIEVISKGQGRFKLEDKQSHLASLAGDSFDMGRCAVVLHQGIQILLTGNRTAPFDLGQWRSQGIDPAGLSVIVVKAAVAHRRAYDPIAARSYWVDTPGPCTSNLKALPYQKIQRPIYPLDETST
jgi:microcystin degradation protein MlrC